MQRLAVALLLLAPLIGANLGCSQYLGYQIKKQQAAEEAKSAQSRVMVIERKYGEYDAGIDMVIEPMAWLVAPLMIIPGLANGEGRSLCWWPPFDLIFRLLGDSGINHQKSSARCYAEHRPWYGRRLWQWFGWFFPGYSILSPPTGTPGLPDGGVFWTSEEVKLKPKAKPRRAPSRPRAAEQGPVR